MVILHVVIVHFTFSSISDLFNCLDSFHIYQKVLVNLCAYQRPSRGVDHRDIRGNSAGFADFCHQFLARNPGIGPLLQFRSKNTGKDPRDL